MVNLVLKCLSLKGKKCLNMREVFMELERICFIFEDFKVYIYIDEEDEEEEEEEEVRNMINKGDDFWSVGVIVLVFGIDVLFFFLDIELFFFCLIW